MEHSIRPEAFYKRENLADVEIVPFETSVVGTAIRFDSKKKELWVNLGYDYYGVIPEEEVTVYPFSYSKDKEIPYQVITTIGKQIRAIVTHRKEERMLILSRRLAMIEAWNSLEIGQNVLASITRIWNNGIFFDIGNGLHSYNKEKECLGTAVEDMSNCFIIGDDIKVKILDKGERPGMKIETSRKLAYPTIDEIHSIYNEGDIVAVIIGNRINEDGYFCEVPTVISGVINTTKLLREGQIVHGVIRKITPKGIKLKHIEIL